MCSGAILLYKIPRVVIGENKSFQGPEEYVCSQGVKVEILNDPACIQVMRDFIKAKPELWNEDIGE
jgi:cytosine deaminase